MIKKFVKQESTVTFDTPFKIATKYTPALFVIAMCLSFANQFLRNIEIDCSYSGSNELSSSSGGGRGGYGSSSSVDSDLNNYCWNFETFLVKKALDPSMRGKVTYPGIWSYVRAEDELIKQKYYKYLWFGLAKIAAVAFAPLFIWKLKGFASTLKSLTDVGSNNLPDDEVDSRRAEYFIETIGFNNGLALYYIFCKTLACLTPIFNLMILTGFIGKLYRFYGYEVMKYILDADGDPWPSPMDALFPKIAKCEWAKYGYTGDLEVKAAQCQLPMNNFTQWSFFVLWWWIVFVLLINIPSLLYIYAMMFGPFRSFIYRKYIAKICRQDVERLRSHKIMSPALMPRKRKLNKILKVKPSLGDWFILTFLEKNLPDYQFRSLMKKVVVTSNPILLLQNPPEPTLTSNADPDNPNKLSNVPMGFILNSETLQPPKYESNDESDGTLSTVTCETPPTQPEPNAPPQLPMGFMIPNLAAAAAALPAKPTPRPKPGDCSKRKDSDSRKQKPPLKPKPKLQGHHVRTPATSNNSNLANLTNLSNLNSSSGVALNNKRGAYQDDDLWD